MNAHEDRVSFPCTGRNTFLIRKVSFLPEQREEPSDTRARMPGVYRPRLQKTQEKKKKKKETRQARWMGAEGGRRDPARTKRACPFTSSLLLLEDAEMRENRMRRGREEEENPDETIRQTGPIRQRQTRPAQRACPFTSSPLLLEDAEMRENRMHGSREEEEKTR